MQIPALIADSDMRRRDERFATQDRYTVLPDPLHDKSRTAATQAPRVFAPEDFTNDANARTCICPAGKALYRKGARNVTRGFVGRGAKRDCVACAMRTQCLRTPDTTPVRNVAFFSGRVDAVARNYTAEMKVQLDTPNGRRQYGERSAAVEPVFGNLRANKRLDRFTLLGIPRRARHHPHHPPAGFLRNGWPESTRMGGRIQPESVAGFGRNTHALNHLLNQAVDLSYSIINGLEAEVHFTITQRSLCRRVREVRRAP